MCGIFGLVIARGSHVPAEVVRSLAGRLFPFSETRGREAAGVAIQSDNALTIYKQSMTASRMIKLPEYRKLFDQVGEALSGIALIGHSRLVTNGSELAHTNNQPVERDGLVAVHNGIIVNDAERCDIPFQVGGFLRPEDRADWVPGDFGMTMYNLEGEIHLARGDLSAAEQAFRTSAGLNQARTR